MEGRHEIIKQTSLNVVSVGGFTMGIYAVLFGKEAQEKVSEKVRGKEELVLIDYFIVAAGYFNDESQKINEKLDSIATADEKVSEQICQLHNALGRYKIWVKLTVVALWTLVAGIIVNIIFRIN